MSTLKMMYPIPYTIMHMITAYHIQHALVLEAAHN